MHIDDIPVDCFFTFNAHGRNKYIYLKLTNYTFISYIDYRSIEKRSAYTDAYAGAYTMKISLLDSSFACNVELLQSILV